MEFSNINFKDSRVWINFGSLFLIFNGLAIINLSSPKAKDTIFFAIIIDVLLFAVLLYARSVKIKIDENGVTRKSAFGSVRIPWSEVRSIRRVKRMAFGIVLNEQIVVSKLGNAAHQDGDSDTEISFNYRQEALSGLQHFYN